MTPDRKLRVFLCHASQDKPIVRELYQRLNAEGWIDPWLDEEKLLPGQDWDLEIEKAVEGADAVVVCLSKNSISKEGYIQREMRKVLDVSDEKPDGTIFVIPVRLDDVQIPRRLRLWQYVDFFPAVKRPSSLLRLIASLKRRAENILIPTESSALENNDIAIEVRILNEDGSIKSDLWFMARPDIKVDELLASIKINRPEELSGDLGDYKIDLELPFHNSINDLKINNGALLTIRPIIRTDVTTHGGLHGS